MRPTDQMLSRIAAEIEEKQTFIDGIVESAENERRDLTSQEMEMVTRSRDRQQDLNAQAGPMQEAARIASESRDRIQQIGKVFGDAPAAREVEYRTAGEYICDMWQASVGRQDARDRLVRWTTQNRAAAHETTGDVPGLLPAPIIGPVVNFIDSARPLVGLLGPRGIPGTGFSRPKVTQHTSVAAQSAEKAELVSQKMTITKLTVSPVTYGGYVNVSRQSADWSMPSVMQIIVDDLAAGYAIATEKAACAAFVAGATAGGTIPVTPTGDVVAAQFWTAAASVYTATKGQGRTVAAVSPDVLGILGPLFQPVNPMNQQGQGFSASGFGQGIAGTISGIPVVVSTGFAAAKTMLVMSTAAAEVYEDRIGTLSVIEPSVLGIQVSYSGYFAPLILEATGIVKVTVT